MTDKLGDAVFRQSPRSSVEGEVGGVDSDRFRQKLSFVIPKSKGLSSRDPI
jgi:hypothetical protein